MPDPTILTVTTQSATPTSLPDMTNIGVDKVDTTTDIPYGKVLSAENGSKHGWIINAAGEGLSNTADGSDVTQGAQADAAWDGSAASATGIAIWKYIGTKIEAVRAAIVARLPAALSAGGNLKVSLQESNAIQSVSGSVSVSALPNTTNAGQTAKTADYDSGVGTDTVTMMGLALPKSGGAVAGGTATDPIRTDPTGTTKQGITTGAGDQADGHSATLGTTTDADTANTVIGRLKKIVTLLSGILTFKIDQTTPGTTNLVALAANQSVNQAQVAGTATSVNSGNKDNGTQRVVLASDQPNVAVKGALPGGAGGWSVAAGSIAATKTDIGTANTAGQVGGWYIYNPNAAVSYVQFFDAQASAVTLGTTTPIYSLGIPATSAANISPGLLGLNHATAISIAVTTTRAGSTGPGSTVDYNIWYKQ